MPKTPLAANLDALDRQLIELLAWCHRNGVIDSSTRLSLHPGSSDLSEFELFNLLGSLQQVAPLPPPIEVKPAPAPAKPKPKPPLALTPQVANPPPRPALQNSN